MSAPILLGCRDLGKVFGPRFLFEGLSFGLFEGERTGLIGPNCTGKSTLLKILAALAGFTEPDKEAATLSGGWRKGLIRSNRPRPG